MFSANDVIGATLRGQIGDGPTAVGCVLDNTIALADGTAKLVSVRNNGVEKAYFGTDGRIYALGWISSGSYMTSTLFTGTTFRATNGAGASCNFSGGTGIAAGVGGDANIDGGAGTTGGADGFIKIGSASSSGVKIGINAPLIIYPQERVPTACVAGAPSAGAGVTAGTHSYKYTFVTPEGESLPSLTSNVITTTAPNGTVAITGILPGSGRVTSRKLYRTDAGDAGNYKLIATIAGNVVTTYSDTAADGAGAAAPTGNKTSDVYLSAVADGAATVSHVLDSTVTMATGDLLKVKNNGAVKLTVDKDGTLIGNAGMYLGFGGNYIFPMYSASLMLQGYRSVDDANAVAVVLDNRGLTLTNAAAKLVSVQNNSVEKLSIDKDGYLSKTAIKGQFHKIGSLTPVDAGTITLDLATTNLFVIDCSALTAAHSFSIIISNHPAAGLASDITVIIKTGAALPTINYPVSWNSPGILTVSKKNYLGIMSIDGGVTGDCSFIGAF